MTELIRQFGVEGYGAYFILMELAVAKIDKAKGDEFTEEHCRFRIHGHVLRQKLGMRASRLAKFLRSCAELSLLEFNSSATQVQLECNSSATQVQLQSTRVEDEFNFYFPKILESLDRDAKRARAERGPPALKKKNKEEEVEREKPAAQKAEVFHIHSGLVQTTILERASEIQAVFEMFSDIFQNRVPPRLASKTVTAKLLLLFKGYDNLHAYLESVVNEKPASHDNPSWRTYVEARIMKQLNAASA